MTGEDKKEILKANFYEFDKDFILETYGIKEEEYNKIIEEGKDYLDELKKRGEEYA